MEKYEKILASLCVISILIAFAPAAMADQNNTTNTTATPTVTPVPTTPVVTTPAVTTPIPSPTEGKFRVGPIVKLRPLNDEINKSSDGLVELFMSNPNVNDVTLHVDVYVSAPSGVHVYGQGFGQGAAAGTVYGSFDVPPGTARTVYMNIKSEKVGDFFLQFSGVYYPGTNKDLYQQLSLTHPFTVRAASPDPLNEKPTNSDQIPDGSGGAGIFEKYWWFIVIVLIIIIAIVALGRGGSKSDITIEQK